MIIIYGFFIGAFVSLIGGGGASLYLGVLTAQLGLPIAQAAATSLFVALPALFFGFITQHRYHNVKFKIGNIMIFAALPSIIIGTIISKYIPSKLYNWLVGIILIIMGLFVFIKSFIHKNTQEHGSKLKAIGFGILSGAMVGIGGLSGGAPTVAGLAILGLNALQAAGTSTYVLCIMSLIGLISHLFISTIAWQAGFTLMIGAILGSVITPIILNHLNLNKINNFLSSLIGIIIIYFGIKLII